MGPLPEKRPVSAVSFGETETVFLRLLCDIDDFLEALALFFRKRFAMGEEKPRKNLPSRSHVTGLFQLFQYPMKDDASLPLITIGKIRQNLPNDSTIRLPPRIAVFERSKQSLETRIAFTHYRLL